MTPCVTINNQGWTGGCSIWDVCNPILVLKSFSEDAQFCSMVHFQILRNLLNECISQFSSTLRSTSCELRVFVWAVGSTHLSLQIRSFRVKDDPKSTNFNNTKYTISFPNSTSGLVFMCCVRLKQRLRLLLLTRGDTWNFGRHISWQAKAAWWRPAAFACQDMR